MGHQNDHEFPGDDLPYRSIEGVMVFLYKPSRRSSFWHFRMRLAGKRRRVDRRGGTSKHEAIESARRLIYEYQQSRRRGPYQV